MEKTNRQFEQVIARCRELFARKLHDYGAAWRILRPCSVTDQLFTDDVQLTCVFRAGDEERFCSAVYELAGGEELARAGEPRFAEF